MKIKVKSRRKEVEEALEEAKIEALEVIGSKVAGYAFMLAPHDTGRLRNSITWATKKSEGRAHQYSDDLGDRFTQDVGSGLDSDTVAIGTNVEYAPYQEFGASKTDAHPFLKPALMNHLDEYKKILETYLGDIE